MLTIAPRAVAPFLLACGAWALTGMPSALAAEANPLSPEAILGKHFTGKATVELLVEEVHLRPMNWAATSHRRWAAVPLEVVAKAGATRERVVVLVSEEAIARLKALGIDNPAEHLRGKVLRVSGTVERLVKRAGTEYRMLVNSLDQVEAIRKP
jgi:hypothetical protein